MKYSSKSTVICLIILLITLYACEKKEVPTLNTSEVTNITATTAICGGTISDEGSGTIIARGVCWSTGNEPTIADSKTTDGAGAGTFTSNVSGLSGGTTYYVRAYASNNSGTGYGMTMAFITLPTDFEGYIYKTVTIGTQLWFSENLKTTRLNDGTTIANITDNLEWSNLSTLGYCWYNNDATTNKNVYGALYNWYVVNTGKLCPVGWHVPTDADWTTLTTFLGGEDVAGGKLKETGTTHWVTPNNGATNESNFSGLPAGIRYGDGIFRFIGSDGGWWSSTDVSTETAFERDVHSIYTKIYTNAANKKIGLSIRCIKN